MSTANTSNPHNTTSTSEPAPSFTKFNSRIIRGYRIGYNLKSLAKSLFQWHNETVNTWTHLLGTIIIFIIIFSSNLFTQHYHSKHQILDFASTIRNHHGQIKSGLLNITSSEGVLNEGVESASLVFVKQMDEIKKDINILLKLTEQDNLQQRNNMISHLKQLTNITESTHKTILGFYMDKTTLSPSQIKQLAIILSDIQLQLSVNILQIITLIEQVGQKVNPIPKWPLLVFFVAASVCLTTSSAYHLFYPHSEKLYKILRKLDFSGVVILIVGSSFPIFMYGASCVSLLAYSYLFIMSFVGLAVFGLLVSGYFDPKQRQKQKSWLFGLFGVSFLIPVFHILVLEYLGQIDDTMMFSNFAKRIVVFGVVYLIGLFIYTVQCPQRFVAGKFDYCGASHQIWHLSVLLALYMTYQLNWDLYYQRRINPCLP